MAGKKDEAAALGTALEVTIKSKKYKLSPLGPGDMAAFKQYLRAQRLSWYREFGRSGDRVEDMQIMFDIVRRPIDDNDMVTEMMGMEGGIFLLWRAIHHNHPDVTLEALTTKFDSLQEIREVLDIATQLGSTKEGEVETETDPPTKS